MITLYVGWEDVLLKECKDHKHGSMCLAGCRELTKNVRARIKELNKLIISGEAVVVEKT